MDALEQLKQDVREGRVGLERLIDVIVVLQRQLEAAQRELRAAQQRIEELEKKSGGPMPPATAKVDEPYSMRGEEKRQQERGKKNKHKLSRNGRRGRLTTADKLKQAERTEQCFPEGVPHDECWLSHTRPVWRLENGRAVLVAYAIYRGPKDRYGKIPGVLGRSEFGLEVVVPVGCIGARRLARRLAGGHSKVSVQEGVVRRIKPPSAKASETEILNVSLAQAASIILQES